MTAGLRPCRGDRRPGDGAVLVEFALLIPLLLMIVFGLVTAGLAFSHKLALHHSARETGRYGATLPVSNFAGLDEWMDDLAARAIENSGGSLRAGAPGFELCIAYVHPAGVNPDDVTKRRLESPSGSVLYELGSRCFDDGRPDDERRVQVRLKREAEIQAFLLRRTVDLTSEGVSKFEAGGL